MILSQRNVRVVDDIRAIPVEFIGIKLKDGCQVSCGIACRCCFRSHGRRRRLTSIGTFSVILVLRLVVVIEVWIVRMRVEVIVIVVVVQERVLIGQRRVLFQEGRRMPVDICVVEDVPSCVIHSIDVRIQLGNEFVQILVLLGRRVRREAKQVIVERQMRLSEPEDARRQTQIGDEVIFDTR